MIKGYYFYYNIVLEKCNRKYERLSDKPAFIVYNITKEFAGSYQHEGNKNYR